MINPPPQGPTQAPTPAPQASAQVHQLTPAQRAAQTRAMRQAGVSPAKGPRQERGAGVSLELWLTTVEDKRLAVTFGVTVGDRPGSAADLPASERAILDLRLTAHADKGELVGFGELERGPASATLEELEAVLPLMRRVNRFLAQAREESDDSSFPATVAALAGHLRVSAIQVREPDGSVRQVKRGAAYVTTLRYAERFLAGRAKAA